MRLTFSLIAVNIAVFIMQAFGAVGQSLAFTPALFMQQPYTILTSMFMHGGIHHLMLNMLGLFTFGSIVEHELGRKKFIILYFFTGFFGSLGYMFFGGSPFIPALGASGAIFGLIGGAAILKPKLIIWTPYGPIPMLAAAVLWGSAEFIGFFGIDTVAQSAHIFGIIGGIIVAVLFLLKIKSKFIAPLTLLPVITMIAFANAIPSEIQSYSIDLDPCYELEDSVEDINTKIRYYSCQEDSIITITRPSRGKFNLASYSKMLPIITEDVYGLMFGGDCRAQFETIDIIDDVAISSGQICNHEYSTRAAICKNIEVIVIEFFKDDQEITGIDCTNLQ